MNDAKLPDGMKFEAKKPEGYFKCECAVFPVGGSNSLCYTTSKERAEWIAAILNKRQPDQGLVEALKGVTDSFFIGDGFFCPILPDCDRRRNAKDCRPCGIFKAADKAKKQLAKYKENNNG